MEMLEWLMMAFLVGSGLIVLVKFMATENVTSNTDVKNKFFDTGPKHYDEDLEDDEDEEVFEGVALGIGPLGELED